MAWPDSSPKAAEPKAPASSKVVEPVDQLGSSTPSAQRSLVVPANQDIGHVQGIYVSTNQANVSYQVRPAEDEQAPLQPASGSSDEPGPPGTFWKLRDLVVLISTPAG